MPRAIVPGLEQLLNQGALGAQDLLIIADVPDGAADSLVGTPLLDATLTVTGVYRCLIPIAGLAASLQVYVTAVFSGGTVTSDLDVLYLLDSWPTIPGKKGVTVTGDGGLTTATLQTITTSALNGEKFAVLDLTLAGTTSVTFTRAEWNGK